MKKPGLNRAVRDLQPMVNHFAHKWTRGHYDQFEDLVQQGNLGIVEAWQSYDENSKASFSSYAFFYIRKYVREYTLKQWNNMNNTAPEEWIPADRHTTAGISEEVIHVRNELAKLDEKSKVIFEMKNEGYTLSEIASALAERGLTKKKQSLESVRLQYNKIVDAMSA